MRVSVLGPVAVRVENEPIAVPGRLMRRLLTRLAVDAPRPVPIRELIEAVWLEADPPDQVGNALQSLVSRLRRVLGGGHTIVQEPGGYRLAGAQVDLVEFDRLVTAGRSSMDAGDSCRAAELLSAALGLWRGEPLADADEAEYASGWVARLIARRLEALADRVDAQLAGDGPTAELVEELEDLTLSHPLRERFGAQLMVALARLGRPAEALAAFERMRATLADQLGVDPSPALSQVHLAVLRGEIPPDSAASTQPGSWAAPPATEAARWSPLRAALTSFVGRDRELERINDLLATGRLVTIVGPGGAGKTRLALEAVGVLAEDADLDQWLVELAPLSDEDSVVPAFVSTIAPGEARVAERPGEPALPRDPMARLVSALRDTHGVLVVDNCEHLVDRVAGVLSRLLAGCPFLRVLATSREPLGVDGESLCVVAPLPLPDPDAGPAEASQSPAVVLFADRARAVRAGFAVDSSSVEDVVEIVRRLDGLPLAIELAAARLRVLPVHEVAVRLSDRFRLLTGGSRSALPRHRTLRAVVEWSWGLLGDDERRMIERLSVFPSGADVPAASAVHGGLGGRPPDVAGLLDSLVDKSLLTIEPDQPAGVRYRMLETIREYGVERLVERGEIDAARSVHAAYFRDLVADQAPQLRTADQLPAFAALGREHDNIVAALRHLGEAEDGRGALSMALDMSWYWILRNEHVEAATWLRFSVSVSDEREGDLRVLAEAGAVLNELIMLEDPRAWESPEQKARLRAMSDGLSRATSLPARYLPERAILQIVLAFLTDDPAVIASVGPDEDLSPDRWTHAMLLNFRAALAENQGDTERMRGLVQAALPEFRAIGDRWGLATVLSSLAYTKTMDGDLDGAAAAYEESAQLMAMLGARIDSGLMGLRLAGLRARQGRLDEARGLVEDIMRSAGGRPSLMEMFGTAMLAMIAYLSGDADETDRCLDEALRVLDNTPNGSGADHGRGITLGMLAVIRALDGETEQARRYLLDAYPSALGTRDRPILASVGVGTAALALAIGEPATAARLLGACAVLRGGDDLTDPIVRKVVARVREALGDRYDAAYASGRGLPGADAQAEVDPARLERLDSSRDRPDYDRLR